MRFNSVAAGILCICWASYGAVQSAGPQNGAQNPASPLAASDYRLGPEDVISVTVYKECPELCVDGMVVRPDGKVSVALIGELAATGKTTSQLEREVAAKLAECCLSEPRVHVALKEVNSSKVSVVGEVKKPDMYKIGTQTTLLDAIALAGGFTDFAKKKITVIRSTPEGPKTYQFEVDRLIKPKSHGDAFYLLPRDTIYVP